LTVFHSVSFTRQQQGFDTSYQQPGANIADQKNRNSQAGCLPY
jgi:hypothetical protein